MRFAPIAIVARACVLPDAPDPDTLFRNVLERRSSVSRADNSRWGVRRAEVVGIGEKRTDHTFCEAGGYVEGFGQLFDPSGFAADASLVGSLDPLFQWVLHCGRECISQVPASSSKDLALRTGLVLGNLGFPSESMARFAEDFYWQRASAVHPYHRFGSGMPALFAAQALGLGRGAFSLDAACASSLYAIKLACDRLHNRSADFMLAGAVNRADDLFLHVGFTALDALSRTGQSRPFHRDADGLLPAEGAALVMLERLEDAVAAGHRVFGVIRGVGLSNDGRGRGLLVPSEDGQERAIRAAYEMAAIDPRDVGLLECHATGTPIGDATEVRSTARVFAGASDVPMGSLKSNLGHLITAAGAAGLIKVLGAFEARVRPPQLHVEDPSTHIDAFAKSPFRLLTAAEEWVGPRRAGISAFGFGGNNAHLVVEALEEKRPAFSALTPASRPRVAVVALGARTGNGESAEDFACTLFSAERGDARREYVRVNLEGLKFPPNDLADTLPQQLLVLEAAREAAAKVELPQDRTITVIGMGCDAEITRYGSRWRAHASLAQALDDRLIDTVKDAFAPPLTAAAVLGTMPNMPANRVSSQLDLRGASFSVSAEESSGLVALQIAANALAFNDADAAVVGAVDLSHESVHQFALASLDRTAIPADAAIVMVLERLDDARRLGHTVLALLDDDVAPNSKSDVFGNADFATSLTERLGSAHAAAGMVDAAAAVLSLHHQAQPSAHEAADPRLGRSRVGVVSTPLLGAKTSVTFAAADHSPFVCGDLPRIHVIRGASRGAVVDKLTCGDFRSSVGSATLAIVAASDEELAAKAKQACAWLTLGGPSPEGVAFREKRIDGEMAFVFAGAGASYSGMGRDLFLAAPDLFAATAARMGDVPHTWLTWPNGIPEHPLDQLWGASLITQTHAALTLGTLGLKPTAAIGYSSGESNALFAFRAWNDIDQMICDGAEGLLFQSDLCAPWSAAQRYAKRVGAPFSKWVSFSVAASAGEVRAALEGEPLAFLSIINAPGDCVIAGDEQACARVVAKLGDHRAISLRYDMIAHCPVVGVEREAWWKLHRRNVKPVDGVRFYSNGFEQAFVPTSDKAAEAITNQALSTLDFPSTIEQAYADGVRVFVEHGPRGRATSWVRSILGEREHLAVSLDAMGRSSLRTVANAVAALVAAGIDVDLEKFFGPLRAEQVQRPVASICRDFAAHPAPVSLPSLMSHTTQQVPAPPLASVFDLPDPEFSSTVVAVSEFSMAVRDATLFDAPVLLLQDVATVHKQMLHYQAEMHSRFMEMQAIATQQLIVAYAALASDPSGDTAPERLSEALVVATAPSAPAPFVVAEPVAEIAATARTYPGPSYDRKDLEHLSRGKISTLFGPQFELQDDFSRQVRMPEPPLLLADRVLGIDAKPGVMGKGTIWTETDVRADSWYLTPEGRMPCGITIESGQADLLLISWMGADWLNRGERVYRLLGCELTYHGSLPKVGETLHYAIHVDSHANQGEVRLFFFHYDCFVDGKLRLSVRGGQAGFFTDEELANSAGILWDPMADVPPASAPLAAPHVLTSKRSLSREDLEAFARGDVADTFGEGFEAASAHVRTPRIAGGDMLFLQRVVTIDPEGGPWKRGYLKGEADISPNDWYFDGHFKNDPCMPGTLMFEGCAQALSVYLTAMGFTLGRDGYRFEPATEEKFVMRCRGQVKPTSKKLTYEVFVAEVQDGDTPTITADLLCTVDGRKAFHARRVSLRLVPDWPLSRWQDGGASAQYQAGEDLSGAALPRLGGLVGYTDSGPVASVDGFAFDYRSLLACAWGKPSEAFGPFYEVFDSPRRVARLPGPPYHFMSRISKVEGGVGALEQGSSVEVVYDVPEQVWYFDENGHPTMPFCVLMEAALQPCGWLASYVGCARASDIDLLFRNLDGVGTLTHEILPSTGPLVTRAKLTRLSQSSGMTIVSFDVESFVGDVSVYKMDTVFGFFPMEAFKDQAGLPVSAEHRSRVVQPSNVLVELAERRRAHTPGPRLAEEMLCMVDRITGLWPEGGSKNLGYLRGEKDVKPDEWFFKAHFFQDPVQPGSLGVEALCQLLQFFMLETGMTACITDAHFEPVMLGCATKWKYRGQVTPTNRLITSEAEILQVGTDDHGPFVIANAWLWVDGKRIYQVENLGMRVRAGSVPRRAVQTNRHELLDPAKDHWLADHCPTYVVPALPMMSMVDRIAAAAHARTGRKVASLDDVKVLRWLAITKPTELLTTVEAHGADSVFVTLLAFRDAKTAELSRFEPVATGLVSFAPNGEAPKPFAAVTKPRVVRGFYDDGSLFHGPAFHYVTELSVGTNGSSAVIDVTKGSVPHGALHQGVLDAMTHAIPHTAFSQWSKEVGNDVVAYPHRIDGMKLYEPLPRMGTVRVEAHFVGLDDTRRFPTTHVQAIVDGRVALEFLLTEVLVPKGPIGRAPSASRRAFLGGSRAEGVSLATFAKGVTRVSRGDVAASDWFPGTLASAYALSVGEESRKAEAIAVREHVAAQAHVHPSRVWVSDDLSSAFDQLCPLRVYDVDVKSTAKDVAVKSVGAPHMALERVRETWARLTGVSGWPMEDLYAALIQTFVANVVLETAQTARALAATPCLFVANHQVGVESVLASVLLSTLTGKPTTVLAKGDHRDSWIGKFIALNARYPGVRDPELTLFVDRDDPNAMVKQFESIADGLRRGERSAMVHIEGTRALSCRTPTTKLSSALLDVAFSAGVPVVPLRFVGGLPIDPLETRLEFPVGFGAQTFFVGDPIPPDALSRMQLRERKDAVLGALNALGGSPDDEVPSPPNAALEREVAQWQKKSGASLTNAVALIALSKLADPSEPTARLLAARATGKLSVGKSPQDQWLEAFASSLLGNSAQ